MFMRLRSCQFMIADRNIGGSCEVGGWNLRVRNYISLLRKHQVEKNLFYLINVLLFFEHRTVVVLNLSAAQ